MAAPTQHVHNAGVGFVNLSPHGFALWARHYLQCRRDFRPPDCWSPVPYFLLCRAIELQLKAWHLEDKRQNEVKRDYGHDLMKSYVALSDDKKILSDAQMATLSAANAMYIDKGFEYFSPSDAVTGFSRVPDLQVLDAIAIRLIEGGG